MDNALCIINYGGVNTVTCNYISNLTQLFFVVSMVFSVRASFLYYKIMGFGVKKMPKYKKKITRLMEYKEFKEAIQDLPKQRQAFLSVLFFTGCRISEALALTSDDIFCTPDMVFIEFFRLKGSKQTDPLEIPRSESLTWLCDQEGDLFPFSRSTGYRIVKRVWSNLYPHFFRMNRISKTLEDFGVPTVHHTIGISLASIEHYIGKVDIKRVGRSLIKEIEKT